MAQRAARRGPFARGGPNLPLRRPADSPRGDRRGGVAVSENAAEVPGTAGGAGAGPVPGPAAQGAGTAGAVGGPAGRDPWKAPAGVAVARAAAPGWDAVVRSGPAAPVTAATLWGVLGAAVAAALLLADGVGIGLLLAVLPAAVAAYAAARTAGRRARPWSLVWAAGCLALLVVPALRDSAWPSFLAVLAAFGSAAFALHGSRTWPGVLLGPAGLFAAAPGAVRWGWAGLRARGAGRRDPRLLPLLKAAGVALVLLVLFGALFASADAAFAELLERMTPDLSGTDGPLRLVLFVLGGLAALAAARVAAAPMRWDRIRVTPGRARSRAEWALPLIVLDLLFAGFNAVQLTVLFGGYPEVLERTGLSYAEYARQGFWQLLWATVLTLAVIALALRWAPRSSPGDRRLVRAVLGALCLLTLVVVASALRRMDLYVDAYGLTRLRLSVAAVELWLGVVLVLIVAAGVFGARLLPRAVAASAGAFVLTFGLVSPDGLVAGRNVARFERDGRLDLEYVQFLSADAVPALDRLPEPLRSCALAGIREELRLSGDVPWYATSLGERRARRILRERPPVPDASCARPRSFDRGSRY
ncbi:DUF4153 domain-containing protein [Streptomyces sp. NPDC086023]|uniref:DUF4153 domain-containing protein n=1 Tax=Streptomyces sp. NPDC086023 TaxID=3365746 RepID=UPI0037D48767